MSDEIKTIDDVMNWLEGERYVKSDSKGTYVACARWNKFTDKHCLLYTGPPMLLSNENDAPKIYLDSIQLESMISRFLCNGTSKEEFHVSIPMERGRDHSSEPNRYSNHTTSEDDHESWDFNGIVDIKLDRNGAGNLRYDAELSDSRFHAKTRDGKSEDFADKAEPLLECVLDWMKTEGQWQYNYYDVTNKFYFEDLGVSIIIPQSDMKKLVVQAFKEGRGTIEIMTNIGDREEESSGMGGSPDSRVKSYYGLAILNMIFVDGEPKISYHLPEHRNHEWSRW